MPVAPPALSVDRRQTVIVTKRDTRHKSVASPIDASGSPRSIRPFTKLPPFSQRASSGTPLPDTLRDDGSSATEAATTPSVIGSPELHAIDSAFDGLRSGVRRLEVERLVPSHRDVEASSLVDHQSRPTSPPKMLREETLLEQLTRLRHLLQSMPNMQTAFSGIHHRLNAIESIASTEEVPGDLVERLSSIDDLDARITELERRIEEIVEGRSATASFERRIVDYDHDGRYEAFLTRLDEVEHRLSSVAAAGEPSPERPWIVEIIVLPWGPELQGIWSNFANQQEPPCSWLKVLPSASSSKDDDDYLWPRACGPSSGEVGAVYERLRSCGCVKDVQLINGAAEHIQGQLLSTFADVLDHVVSREFTGTKLETHFLGLQFPLIPLRKLHKRSRLTYLTPAELITSALWTASFLDSGVMMKAPKAGMRRLYVTTPNAYLQQTSQHGYKTLSWEALRSVAQRITDVANDVEDQSGCWTHIESLDGSRKAGEQDTDEYDASRIESSPRSGPVQALREGSPTVKEESEDETGNLLHFPTTPVSVFDSSQPRRQQTSNDAKRTTTYPVPSSQKRAITSSFESTASAEADPRAEEPCMHARHHVKPRSKRTRYDAVQDVMDSILSIKDDQRDAAMAYATPHSYNAASLPTTRPRSADLDDWGLGEDTPPHSTGGDTDVASEGEAEVEQSPHEGLDMSAPRSSARLLSPLSMPFRGDRMYETRNDDDNDEDDFSDTVMNIDGHESDYDDDDDEDSHGANGGESDGEEWDIKTIRTKRDIPSGRELLAKRVQGR
jgi:hypothetical protein